MAERLEERIRSERELFANISHEIRTPLARLRVALELLEDAPGDSAQTFQRLQGIGGDLTELELLLDNVLTTARLDFAVGGANNFPLHPRAVALDDFFDQIAERFARHYPGRFLDINTEGLSPTAVFDPNLINRACDNLLDNAVKYNSPGRPVILKAVTTNERFAVEVSDYGKGVAEKDLVRLFDPFFRSHRSRSRRTGGAGLGLTLCKRIVEAHGGRIMAELNQDQGMTFRNEPASVGKRAFISL